MLGCRKCGEPDKERSEPCHATLLPLSTAPNSCPRRMYLHALRNVCLYITFTGASVPVACRSAPELPPIHIPAQVSLSNTGCRPSEITNQVLTCHPPVSLRGSAAHRDKVTGTGGRTTRRPAITMSLINFDQLWSKIFLWALSDTLTQRCHILRMASCLTEALSSLKLQS